MTNFGWDLPPGVSSLPGDFDQTVSYTATWLYTDSLEDGDLPDDIPKIIKSVWHHDVIADMTTFRLNTDDTFNVDVSYSDDIEMDIKHLDYSDIEDAIIEHLNEVINERHFTRKDNDLDITFEVH